MIFKKNCKIENLTSVINFDEFEVFSPRHYLADGKEIAQGEPLWDQYVMNK